MKRDDIFYRQSNGRVACFVIPPGGSPYRLQTASRFCLRQCGCNSTVPDRPNPADVHRLILTHEEPLFVRCAALMACRAEIYRIPSAAFRTSGKAIVTWVG